MIEWIILVLLLFLTAFTIGGAIKWEMLYARTTKIEQEVRTTKAKKASTADTWDKFGWQDKAPAGIVTKGNYSAIPKEGSATIVTQEGCPTSKAYFDNGGLRQGVPVWQCISPDQVQWTVDYAAKALRNLQGKGLQRVQHKGEVAERLARYRSQVQAQRDNLQ